MEKDYKEFLDMEQSDIEKKLMDKISEVNEYKREFVSHGEISRISNEIIQYMRDSIVSTIENEYESEYNRDETDLRDVLIEILPNKMNDIIYERTRDMIIKDNSKIDEYDKLQDHIVHLFSGLRFKRIIDEMKKDKKESEEGIYGELG